MDKKTPEELIIEQIQLKGKEIKDLTEQLQGLLCNPAIKGKEGMAEKHRRNLGREGLLDFLQEFATNQKNVTHFSLFEYRKRVNKKYEEATSHWKFKE